MELTLELDDVAAFVHGPVFTVADWDDDGGGAVEFGDERLGDDFFMGFDDEEVFVVDILA